MQSCRIDVSACMWMLFNGYLSSKWLSTWYLLIERYYDVYLVGLKG